MTTRLSPEIRQEMAACIRAARRAVRDATECGARGELFDVWCASREEYHRLVWGLDHLCFFHPSQIESRGERTYHNDIDAVYVSPDYDGFDLHVHCPV